MDNNEFQEKSQTTTTVKKIPKKPSRFVKYILDHKLVFSLIFALIVVYFWGQWRYSKLEKQQKILIESYNKRIDSVQLSDMLLTSKAFSWAVRTDLLRNNPDQIQLYLNNIVREPHITKAFVVDTKKSIILFSSNSAEAGTAFLDVAAMQTKETFYQQRDSIVRFISPFMELNSKAGITVIEASFK